MRLPHSGGDVMAYVRDNRRLNMLGFQPQTLIMQPSGVAPAPSLPQIEPSLAAWNNAQEANTADSYRNFLFDNPAQPLCRRGPPPSGPDRKRSDPLAEIAEDGLNLTRNERRAIQRNLTLLEFNTRGVDGIFGPGTRGAIRNWQQNNGFAQTSYLTTEQINRIDGQASRLAAEIAAEEERRARRSLVLIATFGKKPARVATSGLSGLSGALSEGIFAGEARNACCAE